MRLKKIVDFCRLCWLNCLRGKIGHEGNFCIGRCPMTSASADFGFNSAQLAENDLALYAAIIGCKPIVEAIAPETPQLELPPVEIPNAIETAPPEDHPHRITIWVRHVSDEAKKRIHEARMRLAS